MGWGRTLLLGDIGNRLDIADVENDIASVKDWLKKNNRKDASQDEQLATLINENAELKLYLAGLTRLLVAKDVISKDELEQFIDAVDAEDGALDGKFDGEMM